MFFKKKGRKDLKVYDPKEIYVITTEIISECNDASGGGPRCTTQYYLATKEDGRFYELFSKVEIKYADNSTPGFTCMTFNISIIKEVEDFKDYVVNKNTKMTDEELFYFLNMLNARPKVLQDL